MMKRNLPQLLLKKKHFLLALIAFVLFTNHAQGQQSQTKPFKPSGKIWGLVFGDYAYKLHADSAQRGNTQYSKLPASFNSFNFRRIYIGYDY
ncbi:MAG: hypothetical protein ACYCOO_10530, partial [Chitinophagaceae bacterium]